MRWFRKFWPQTPSIEISSSRPEIASFEAQRTVEIRSVIAARKFVADLIGLLPLAE